MDVKFYKNEELIDGIPSEGISVDGSTEYEYAKALAMQTKNKFRLLPPIVIAFTQRTVLDYEMMKSCSTTNTKRLSIISASSLVEKNGIEGIKTLYLFF